jgi:hypothetical protein
MNARVAPKTSLTEIQLPGSGVDLSLSALNAHIATELAAGLSDAAAIRERYGITAPQWEVLKKNPTFRGMLAEAVRNLRGDLNAGVRIQKKADIVLEDAIPAYDGMIHNGDIPAQARIDAGKLLAQLAGRNSKEGGNVAIPGSGFTLNINLGGGREKLVIDGKNLAVETDE